MKNENSYLLENDWESINKLLESEEKSIELKLVIVGNTSSKIPSNIDADIWFYILSKNKSINSYSTIYNTSENCFGCFGITNYESSRTLTNYDQNCKINFCIKSKIIKTGIFSRELIIDIELEKIIFRE